VGVLKAEKADGSIKMNHRETDCVDVNWIDLLEGYAHWWAFSIGSVESLVLLPREGYVALDGMGVNCYNRFALEFNELVINVSPNICRGQTRM
jgi:hypothetical protein